LDEEKARSQELKGMMEHYQLQMDEKQRELKAILQSRSAEICLNEELLLKQQQLERKNNCRWIKISSLRDTVPCAQNSH
jgi:hypothetical protein